MFKNIGLLLFLIHINSALPYDIIIRNCHVLKPDSSVQENCDIVVDQRKIIHINPSGIISESATTEIDAHGMIALPGLINTHAHTAMALFRGVAEDVPFSEWWYKKIRPLEEKLTADDIYWGTMLGLAQMVQNGITTVADHYFCMDSVAQAFFDVGVRGILGEAIFDMQGRQALEKTRSFVSQWHGRGNGLIATVVAPHAPYTCNPNFLSEVAELAQELHVGIHLHAAETQDQTDDSRLRYNQTPIEILSSTKILDNQPVIIAHGCGMTSDDMVLLENHPNVGIACAPKTYGKLAMGFTPVSELLLKNIALGLATDGAASNNSYDLFEAMRLMSFYQKNRSGNPTVFPASQLLKIATQGGARVLGLENLIGQLEIGFLADIILVNLDGLHHQPVNDILTSLVYNTAPGDVDTVIIHGKVIMHNKKFTTINLKNVLQQAHASITRLRETI